MGLGKTFQAEDRAGAKAQRCWSVAWVAGRGEAECVLGLACRLRTWMLSCGLWGASRALGKGETWLIWFQKGPCGCWSVLALPGTGRSGGAGAHPESPLCLDQVTPEGLSSSDSHVGIAMETSRFPSGDRPRKSLSASHVDLDPHCPPSAAVFFFPKAMFEPGSNQTGCPDRRPVARALLRPAQLILDAVKIWGPEPAGALPAQSTVLYPET